MNEDYLSIVVTSRNDNHGGDMLKRMGCFINNLIYQANRCKFKTELIVVEWNTPANMPLLNTVLPVPKNGDYLTVRYIVVPPEIHQQYKHADVLGLYQMIAKNVGIRRSKGEYILCTNIDVLFSDKCFDLLAKKKLQKGVYYRANRCDIPADVMDITTPEEQLKYGEKHIMKRLGMNDRYRWVRGLPEFFYGFPNALKLVDILWGAVEGPLRNMNTPIHGLDTVACGDFTLMHYDDWAKIEGYAELDMYSLHIDSMALIAAAALGIKQQIFAYDCCIYHIYHKDGWEALENPVDMIKFTTKRPGLDWFSVFYGGKYIIDRKRGWELNPPDWGFANQQFQEIVLNA